MHECNHTMTNRGRRQEIECRQHLERGQEGSGLDRVLEVLLGSQPEEQELGGPVEKVSVSLNLDAAAKSLDLAGLEAADAAVFILGKLSDV